MNNEQSMASETDDNEITYIKEVNITSYKLLISFLDGEEIEAIRQDQIHYVITDLKTRFSYSQHHHSKELMSEIAVFANCKIYGDYRQPLSNILSFDEFLNQMDTESLIRENISLYRHDDKEFLNMSISEGEFFEMKIGGNSANLYLPRTQFQNFINKIEKNNINKARATSELELEDAKFYKCMARYDSKSKLEKLCDGLVIRIGDHQQIKHVINTNNFKINCDYQMLNETNDDEIKDLEITIEVNHKEQTNDELIIKLFSQLRETIYKSTSEIFKIIIFGFVILWLINIFWPYASDYLRYFYEISFKN